MYLLVGLVALGDMAEQELHHLLEHLWLHACTHEHD